MCMAGQLDFYIFKWLKKSQYYSMTWKLRESQVLMSINKVYGNMAIFIHLFIVIYDAFDLQ